MDRRNWFKRAIAGLGALLIPASQSKAFTYGGGTIVGMTNFPHRPGPLDYYYAWDHLSNNDFTNDPDPRLANGLPYGGRDVQYQLLNGELWMDRLGENREGMFTTYVRIGEHGCIRGLYYKWNEYCIPMQYITPGKPHKAGAWVPIIETVDTHTPGVIPGRVLSEEEAVELFKRERLMDKTQAELDAFHDRYHTQVKSFCITGKVEYKITEAGYDQLAKREPLPEGPTPFEVAWEKEVLPVVDLKKVTGDAAETFWKGAWPTKLKEITEQVTIGSF